jgi:hypothetical protein
MPLPTEASSNVGRFSDDLRWVIANLKTVANSCGASAITSVHLLAAIAKHPRACQIFGLRAPEVLAAVYGDRLDPNPVHREIDMDPELRTVIRGTINCWLNAKQRRSPQIIEVDDVLDFVRTIPDSAAYRILEGLGMVPTEDKPAG